MTSTTNNSDNNINESEEYDKEDIKIEDLYKKLQKKEILINELNSKLDQLNLNNTNNSENMFNNDNEQEYYNLNLLTLDNKKINIKNKCNLRCWNCTYKFDNLPCFIPEKYNDNIYYVFGCFCSFNCAASYNLYYLNDSRTNSRQTLIQNLYNKIFKNNNKIIFASKKENLVDYGGKLTIKEYRKSFQILKKEYKINIPPMIPLIHELKSIQF